MRSGKSARQRTALEDGWTGVATGVDVVIGADGACEKRWGVGWGVGWLVGETRIRK